MVAHKTFESAITEFCNVVFSFFHCFFQQWHSRHPLFLSNFKIWLRISWQNRFVDTFFVFYLGMIKQIVILFIHHFYIKQTFLTWVQPYLSGMRQCSLREGLLGLTPPILCPLDGQSFCCLWVGSCYMIWYQTLFCWSRYKKNPDYVDVLVMSSLSDFYLGTLHNSVF